MKLLTFISLALLVSTSAQAQENDDAAAARAGVEKIKQALPEALKQAPGYGADVQQTVNDLTHKIDATRNQVGNSLDEHAQTVDDAINRQSE